MAREAKLNFLAINQSRTTKEKAMLKLSFTLHMSWLAPTPRRGPLF
jgi:hypothetical protein